MERDELQRSVLSVILFYNAEQLSTVFALILVCTG